MIEEVTHSYHGLEEAPSGAYAVTTIPRSLQKSTKRLFEK